MKKIVIFSIIVSLLIISLTYLVFSQIPGEFTIGNSDPAVSSFEVQKADSSWDSLIPIETHISDTVLRWTINDFDGDALATTLCIGTSANPYSNTACNVVNYIFASASDGDTQTYTYNTDPTGTLQGTPDTINFLSSNCASQPCTKTYYVDVIVDDGQGGNVISLNSFELTDYLPEFVNVYLSDSALIIPDNSCEDYLPQSCLINPTQGNYTSINARLTITDLDADCSLTSPHTNQIILCMVNATGPDICDPLTNADYIYSLSFLQLIGSDCDFEVSIPVGDPQGIEFFKTPGVYKMYINATSQAGPGTINFPASPQWEYGSIPAPLFPAQVFLGDRIVDGGNGIQLGQWNPGLFSETITNQGNVILNLDWEATDPATDASTCDGHTATCWDLSTSPDLQLDDDASQVSDGGTLLAVNVPEGPVTVQFRPVGGLQLCDVMTCDSGIDETLTIHFHIMPPVGLSFGTYQTDFTVTASAI